MSENNPNLAPKPKPVEQVNPGEQINSGESVNKVDKSDKADKANKVDKDPNPPSAEVLVAMEKVEALKNAQDTWDTLYLNSVGKSSKLWGEKIEDRPDSINEYHESLRERALDYAAQLAEADRELLALRRSSEAKGVEKEPSKEKKGRWRKIGGRVLAVLAVAGSLAGIIGGVNAINNHNNEAQSLGSQDGVSAEAGGVLDKALEFVESINSVDTSDLAETQEAGEKESSGGEEKHFFSQEKEKNNNLDVASAILLPGTETINPELSDTEITQTLIKEKISELEESPLLAAQTVAVTELGEGSIGEDSLGTRAMELNDIFRENPEVQAEMVAPIIASIKNGNSTVAVRTDSDPFNSTYGYVDADGNPEFAQSYIDDGGERVVESWTYNIEGKSTMTVEYLASCGQLRLEATMQGVQVVSYIAIENGTVGEQTAWVKKDLDPGPPARETPSTPSTPETPGTPGTPETPETPTEPTEPTEPTDPTPEGPAAKESSANVDADADLDPSLNTGGESMETGTATDNGYQAPAEVTPPPQEYVAPAPPAPAQGPAQGAEVVAPVERQQEVPVGPSAEGAGSDVGQEVQQDLQDSGAGQLDNGEGNVGGVDG